MNYITELNNDLEIEFNNEINKLDYLDGLDEELKKDIILGKKKEIEILPIIKQYFKRDILKSNERFDKYDFYDNEYKYELKNRLNYYSSFNTTLLGYDKILNCNQIFLFNFYDGLYYIKYNEQLFNTFDKKLFVRTNRTNLNCKKKDYIYIPIKWLIKIY